MITHDVLIDYENVQPKDLVLLRGRNCRTMVFVGKDQELTVECAASLQPLGESVEYIQINGNGRNALDFHIAFHLGGLAARAPAAHFSIVSSVPFPACTEHGATDHRDIAEGRADRLGGRARPVQLLSRGLGTP